MPHANPTPERKVSVRLLHCHPQQPCVSHSREFLVEEHKATGSGIEEKKQDPIKSLQTLSLPVSLTQPLYLQAQYKSFRDHLAAEGHF